MYMCAHAHTYAHTHSSGWATQANSLSAFQKVQAEMVEHFGQELMLWSQTARAGIPTATS